MIIPTAKDNQEDRLMKRWSVLKTVCITILSLFLLLFLYVFISIANYIHQVKVNETNYYTTEARMPQYAEVSDRYGMADGGFYSFETKKYKSLDKLGEALPAGCARQPTNSRTKESTAHMKTNFFLLATNLLTVNPPSNGKDYNPINIRMKPVVLSQI